jgi:hypothetical protein
VVCTLGVVPARTDTRGVHTREEATMPTTIDAGRDRTTDRRAALAEDVAYVVVLFSIFVIAAAIVVAAFVI